MGNDLIVQIVDDGVGMTGKRYEQALADTPRSSIDALDILPEGSGGLGLAMRNINERIKSYYGQHSYMRVDSARGKGTTVELYLHEGVTK